MNEKDPVKGGINRYGLEGSSGTGKNKVVKQLEGMPPVLGKQPAYPGKPKGNGFRQNAAKSLMR